MLALAQRLKTFSPGSDTGLALGVAALIAATDLARVQAANLGRAA